MAPRSTARERLIDGMRASLRARGYGNTSMKDLLKAQGVSSGSMYHAFPGGKEALAAATIRQVGLDAAGLIAGVFATRSVRDGVTLIFDALQRDLVQSDFTNGCPIGVPATEAAGVSAEIGAAAGEVFAAWAEAYRNALRAEGWPEAEAARLATVIVTLYEGALALARTLRDPSPIEQAKAHILSHLSTHPPTPEPP